MKHIIKECPVSVCGRRSVLLVLFTASVLSLALAGCSSPSSGGEEPKDAWTEPAWMTERRQELEELTRQIESCADEVGFPIDVQPDNSYTLPLGLAPEVLELKQVAMRECMAQDDTGVIEDPPHDVLLATMEMAYDQSLDTAACLENEGYEVSEPPSKETYVDAAVAGNFIWAPFDELADKVQEGLVDMDEATYYELYVKCPQAGFIRVMSWVDEK